MSAPRSKLTRIAIGLALALLVVCVIEGAASLFLFAWDLAVNAEAPLPERVHTVHDAELGWVNKPSLRAPDLYGPGRDFSSNARGFRGSAEVSDAIPEGRIRLVCSGDSFTLGYGVGDGDAWPAQLAALDPRLECVNLGQGGYGLDQAYLWYAHAGDARARLAACALIADDFERLRSSSFLGYGKPRLALEGGELVARNVPVPRASYTHPWLTQNKKRFFELRLLSFAVRAFGRAGAAAGGEGMPDEEAERVATRVFAELAELNARKHSRLVLVFLPNKDPHAPGRLSRLSAWMQRAVDAARASGAAWIDLTPAFERLEPAQLEALFIPRGEIQLFGAAGTIRRPAIASWPSNSSSAWRSSHCSTRAAERAQADGSAARRPCERRPSRRPAGGSRGRRRRCARAPARRPPDPGRRLGTCARAARRRRPPPPRCASVERRRTPSSSSSTRGEVEGARGLTAGEVEHAAPEHVERCSPAPQPCVLRASGCARATPRSAARPDVPPAARGRRTRRARRPFGLWRAASRSRTTSSAASRRLGPRAAARAVRAAVVHVASCRAPRTQATTRLSSRRARLASGSSARAGRRAAPRTPRAAVRSSSGSARAIHSAWQAQNTGHR